MELPRYVLDPDDPRAPPQDVWDAMSELERRRVVASLPSEIPRATPPEGDAHSSPKARAREALDEWFRRRGRSVYLGSELAVYYPDEPVFGPDLIAILDVDPHPRESWLVSQEQRGLDFVLEIHVHGDRKKDFELQVERLARLGVPEYFVYEPLRRRITGHRLPSPGARVFVPIVPQVGRWPSRVLDLDLALDGSGLRFFAGPAPLPDARELIDRLSTMVDGAVQRAEEESKRAEEESKRAEEESKRAEEESKRAELLAAKLRALGIDPDSLE